MRHGIFALILSLLAVDARAQDAAPADTIAVGWGMSLDALTPDPIPARFVAVCPPGGAAQSTIWGTGTYTSDSSICVAAVHTGAFSLAAGGAVVVESAPGLDQYVGSLRNGISSLQYPAWQLSFRFPDVSPVAPDTLPDGRIVHDLQGDWLTEANAVAATTVGVIRMTCPPGGAGGSVWGTDIYTDDSSICEAAVHAGVIRRAEGGVVHFERLGGQPSFQGSQRNGVSTLSYPTWPGSFRFVRIEAGT
jgi:hypothetical protein